MDIGVKIDMYFEIISFLKSVVKSVVSVFRF